MKTNQKTDIAKQMLTKLGSTGLLNRNSVQKASDALDRVRTINPKRALNPAMALKP